MDEENKNINPTSDEVEKNTEPEVKETPKAEPVPAPEPEPIKEEPKVEPKVEEKPKKKKKTGLIISIVLILLIVIGGAIAGTVYALMFSKTEVDLSKYVSIDFEGYYEGYASVDEDDLVIDQKGLKKLLDDKSLAKKLEKKLLDKAVVEDNENLKNGDEVEVKFKISDEWLKENKIKLTSNKVVIKVKDLEETDAIDLFEDIEITYSGVSPYLTVYIENNSSDSFIQNNVDFLISADDYNSSYYSLYDIANGDKLTVTAEYDESDLERAGYAVVKDEYTFTVEGQAEYLLDVDDLSDDVKSEIEKELLAEAKDIADYSDYDVTYAYHEEFADAGYYSWDFTHSEPELVDMYLAVNKDMENIGWYDNRNIILAIYKSTFTDTATSKTYDFYIPVYVYDVAVDEDGLSDEGYYYYSEYSSYDMEDPVHKTADGLYQFISGELDSDYTITKF